MQTFDEKVRNKYYENLVVTSYGEDKKKWREETNKADSLFFSDAIDFAISKGVPSKYAKNVVYYAREQGHSSGYYEVLSSLWNLIEVFKD